MHNGSWPVQGIKRFKPVRRPHVNRPILWNGEEGPLLIIVAKRVPSDMK